MHDMVFWMAFRALIGAEIRALRKEKGLTKAEFGAAIGVNERTVYNWERGDAPAWAGLVLAAYVYGLQPWPVGAWVRGKR